MDLKKAMRLLGFPCDQSFAKTDIDQVIWVVEFPREGYKIR